MLKPINSLRHSKSKNNKIDSEIFPREFFFHCTLLLDATCQNVYYNLQVLQKVHTCAVVYMQSIFMRNRLTV